MASTHAISASRMKELVNLYKTAAGYPFLKSMRVVGTEADRVFIQGWWSQRNLEMKTERRFLTNYYLNSDLTLVSTEFPVDCTTELMSSLTHDKRRQAVLRQVKEDTSTKQFIEIWEQSRIVKNYDLAALNVHGDVYTDVEFRSFEWSPDNTKLLYIAEKKQPKSEPFYKQKSLDEKNSKQDDEASVGNEYIYKPHWGEQYVGKHRPVVAILDTTTDSITILSGIPDELSPGQVLWTKGQDVIGVAWRHEPRHLGLVACTNRHSWIFLWKNGEYRKLSPDGHAVHSPRLSPDGSYLVWLQREAGVVPHHNAHALVMRDLRLAEDHIHEIVEVVRTSKEINNGRQFYGIYGRLPNRCWTEDSQYLIFSTPQKMNIVSYIVNLKTKAITEINNDRTSLMVGDVKDNIILFLHTSVNRPTGLIVGRFGSKAVEDGNVYLTSLTPLEFQVFKDIKLEPSDYSYDNDEEINQFNYIYVGPDSGEDKSVPMILIPHGGPHSNFANTFSLDSMFFALAGFAIVLVNYRGSTGMGSATVEYLQGRVGDVDVRDCITATQEALKKYPWLDPDRVGLCGGSHGGFLVAHLSAQAPDMFKAVVARNPVIDISIMVGTSDIPDWCAVEAGCPYDIIAGPQPDNMDIYVKMKKCSPIVHVDRVKAPTLICLGTKDLRVPPSQGAMWYHRLKANSVKTKMLVYEDNHQLGSGPVEIDNLINDCLWLLEHTSTRKASGEKE
ncbi:acylamino-acid-releasing enzyme isoform X2 [Ooceraea biroi]|uniref:Prolyl endopeptidase n=1 Tax=Ooceraea biroi TaxID=2015173 RepID=A0A026WDI3_OOCBI|nr:acylamino-acid-releasing enzyme isoform X2 [Ooceraea biroi]EZA54140.1 Acylamino-acid-releasing enzyme [Ooceraea biroi]